MVLQCFSFSLFTIAARCHLKQVATFLVHKNIFALIFQVYFQNEELIDFRRLPEAKIIIFFTERVLLPHLYISVFLFGHEKLRFIVHKSSAAMIH